jgi:5-methylcytosine-specific restriction protein B
MIRFIAFPDRVERMSSNNDRRRILEAFGIASERDTRNWSDQQLDDALLKLRSNLTKDNPSDVIDFYEPAFRKRWAPERKVKTIDGEVSVVVPKDNDEAEDEDEDEVSASKIKTVEARQSIQVQAKIRGNWLNNGLPNMGAQI